MLGMVVTIYLETDKLYGCNDMEALAFLGPVALYMISMTITPGPNNVMLTASGANYGFLRTLPHIFGILGGCFMLFASIALGLGLIFERYPMVQVVLRLVGSAYLLYLAWKIATAPPPDLRMRGEGRPLSFWQAAAFQFANPKAWVMGLALMAGAYLGARTAIGGGARFIRPVFIVVVLALSLRLAWQHWLGAA